MKVCVDRPKDYRLTISTLGADSQRAMVYFNVDGDAPFLWRGWKVEFNQDWFGDAGIAVRFFDNEGYSPTDSPISLNLMPNCFAMPNASFTGLINEFGAGQNAALWNPQLVIPPAGRIGVQLVSNQNWDNGAIIRFIFTGVKRYQ